MEGKTIGFLQSLWQLDVDPDDASAPYTPYTFSPAGRPTAVANMSLSRDWSRRESVMVIPSMDSVLDGYGRNGGPMDRRDVTFTFRVRGNDQDAAYDLLAAQVAPGYPVRMWYQTDSGALWFTIAYNTKIAHTLTAAGRGLTPHCDFTVTWRIRPYWTLRYPELQGAPKLFSPAHTETFLPLHTERFPAPGMTVISSAAQAFTLDATGVAGSTLPTIPDRGVVFFFVGPCGGDAGIEVIDFSSWTRDTTGVRVQRFFTLGFNLPTVNDTASVDFSKQAFYHNGVPFRPFKPAYQAEYFEVEPGIVNNCAVNALGSNPLTGGSLTKSWWKKRA